MHLEAGVPLTEEDDRGLRKSWTSEVARAGNPAVWRSHAPKYARMAAIIVATILLLVAGSMLLGVRPLASSSTIDKQPPGIRGKIQEDHFPPQTNFLVMGDYGTGDESQKKVAKALMTVASELDPAPAFVLSTGDQIYPSGFLDPKDPVLSERFEQMYDSPALDIPWYITIGNHDCEGSINAMLQYARTDTSKWHFPKRYYSVDHPVAPKTILRMIVLDECDLVCGQQPRNDRCTENMNDKTSPSTRLQQYRWLEQVLESPKPFGVDRMWTVVVGHWGVYSYAGNGPTSELIQNLDPLLQKYHVHAYFSGHDHCMQHMRRIGDDKWARNFFVSGAGGYELHDLEPKARGNADLVHAAMTHGFMSVSVTTDTFRVQFMEHTGEILYTTEVAYD